MIGLDLSLLCLAAALLLTATGQLFFRLHYVRDGRIYLVLALGTFMLVPFFSYLALRNLTLATVYMSTALIHVLVLALSHFFLKERISGRQYFPISLIIAGIIIFNF